MGARIAHGYRKNLKQAILDGKVPGDTIVVTHDTDDPEILFVDRDGNIELICEKTRFNSKEAAEVWFKKYPCPGLLISILSEDGEWEPWIVKNREAEFTPVYPDITKILVIDGGEA